MEGNRREHRPPVPLATLEMQKRVTRELRLPGERVMKLAEELYQAGFISYPRTETDRFSNDYDLLVSQADSLPLQIFCVRRTMLQHVFCIPVMSC